jgi:hypothetical protein
MGGVTGVATSLPKFIHGNSNRFISNLTTSGNFTVKSIHEYLMNSHSRFPTIYLWKLKVPLNTKICMWFIHRNFYLQKINYLKDN